MTTKNTKFKNLQISKVESKNLKGGYADNGIGGGTGSTGFIIWDDLDPRDNGFISLIPTNSIAAMPLKFKKN